IYESDGTVVCGHHELIGRGSLFPLLLARETALCPYTTLFRSARGRRRSRPPGARRGPGRSGRGPRRGGRSQSHPPRENRGGTRGDRKSTRLNSSHVKISYAVFCLKKKKT